MLSGKVHAARRRAEVFGGIVRVGATVWFAASPTSSAIAQPADVMSGSAASIGSVNGSASSPVGAVAAPAPASTPVPVRAPAPAPGPAPAPAPTSAGAAASTNPSTDSSASANANASLTSTSCPSDLQPNSRCASGRDSVGACYQLAVPPAWNGTLVVHAHGGPELGAPKAARVAEDLQRWSIWNRAGDAYAGSGYRQGGVAVTSAAEDTERARALHRRLRRAAHHHPAWPVVGRRRRAQRQRRALPCRPGGRGEVRGRRRSAGPHRGAGASSDTKLAGFGAVGTAESTLLGHAKILTTLDPGDC